MTKINKDNLKKITLTKLESENFLIKGSAIKNRNFFKRFIKKNKKTDLEEIKNDNTEN